MNLEGDLLALIFAPGISTHSLGAGGASATSGIGTVGVQVSVTGAFSLRHFFSTGTYSSDTEGALMVADYREAESSKTPFLCKRRDKNIVDVWIDHARIRKGGEPRVYLHRLGGNADYAMDMHQKEQLHDNSMSMMQSQHFSMVRSAGFNLRATYSSHRPQQQQQHVPSVSSSGVSFTPGNNQDMLHVHGSDMFPSSHSSYHSQMGRSAGFNLGATYSSHRPQQQQQHAPSVSSSGVSFTPGNNQDLLHVHGSDMFPSSHSSYHSQTSGPPGIGLRPLNSPSTVSGMGSYDQLIQQYQQHQNQSQFRLQQMSAVNQSFKDQGMKSMQAAQSAPDRYGLLGLLSVIRMSDPDLTSLALGIDLTTLGLNLNSTENLHKTFGSPWSDEPAKGDPEFNVPQCYFAKQPPALHQGYFTKFSVETLFYIFYSMPKDEAQLYAANELLWPVVVLATGAEQTRARPLGRADRQAAAYGGGGMKTSGGHGRRIKKRELLHGRRPHLPPPALWMTRRNPLAAPVTEQSRCATAAMYSGGLCFSEGPQSTTYKLIFLVQRLNISVVLVFATAMNVSTQVNAISMLNGMNFKVWKENVEIILGCMDLDLALRTGLKEIVDFKKLITCPES
ncbi:putative NOT transcription complex subunit VIP2 [Morus notabilis]|uniref:Putative NOT transcription complex subunit VIP2 n=1 Tax=Morus notabilis TaxID=981085 RepID=W9RQY7_9ROSA|nr:putative NOT transcription complex subunit VIP2 [Morus notabilis]